MIPNRQLLLVLLLGAFSFSAFSQVKIGDSPATIDAYSILELESKSLAFVMTRMSTTEMNALRPIEGALVYNTTEKCIFLYKGATWSSLCESGLKVTTASTAPAVAQSKSGDFWINTSTTRAVTNIFNGTSWMAINANPKSGAGDPNTKTGLNPIAGDIYVDETAGAIYIYNGTSWANNTAATTATTVTAGNGLSISPTNVIEFGGSLTKPTVLPTTSINTLAITGLNAPTAADNHDFVVVDRTTGVLNKVAAIDVLREEEVVLTASNGQVQFSPPKPVNSKRQIDVYRNGVRIEFSVVNTTTIELEPEATCYAGDKIRIVQVY